jgi:hypothetical protein
MKNVYALIILAIVTTLTISGCFEGQKGFRGMIDCQGKFINADCIVTTFTAENGPYVSQQYHQICMSEPIIEISADEPQGKVQYSLSGDVFSSSTPSVTFTPTLVKLLLTTMRLGDEGWSMLANSKQTAKLFGTKYKVLRITGPQRPDGIISADKVPWAEITLYGNMGKKVVERVSVKNISSGENLTSFAYNWRLMEETGKRLPSKIDVLNTENGDIGAPTILKIHYLSFKDGSP